jgi:hypothetical protein
MPNGGMRPVERYTMAECGEWGNARWQNVACRTIDNGGMWLMGQWSMAECDQ